MSDDHGTVPFGAGWRFGAYADGSERPGFDDSALTPVTLPHTVAPLGESPFDFAAAGGAGAVWIRSRPGQPGEVTVRASHPGLGRAQAGIRVRRR